MFDEYLQALGLRIQTRLRVLICTGCETVLLPKSVLRHFSDHHRGTQLRISERKILDIATKLNLLNEMPKIQSPVLYYQGLTLFSGLFQMCILSKGIWQNNNARSLQHRSSWPIRPYI